LKNWEWDKKFYESHIFFTFLKNSTVKQKKEYFNEFHEYLRLLNVETLKPYFEQLSNHGFSDKKYKFIHKYLTEMKENSSNFVNTMRSTIL
jgi:hypothetical protein